LRHFRFKQWFLILGVVAASATNSLCQKTEDYRVYDAVIREMFRGGVTQFDMNAKIDQIVIRDRTFSEYARGIEKESWDHVKTQMRSLTDETIAGYELARKNERTLTAKFDIAFKYQLITDKQLAEIFEIKNDYDKSFEYWDGFYKIYPNSAGYNSFSRVGYDKAGRYALVYFVNWCRTLCGTGTYLLVEKGQSGWVVKEGAGMWIS